MAKKKGKRKPDKRAGEGLVDLIKAAEQDKPRGSLLLSISGIIAGLNVELKVCWQVGLQISGEESVTSQ